jgi:hypothetical protein
MDEREQLIKDLKEIAEEIKEYILQESNTGEQHTQVKEKEINDIIDTGLRKRDYTFEPASSQQPYDRRNVTKPGWTEKFQVEFKSTTSNVFVLNTTMPSERYEGKRTIYLFMKFKKKKNSKIQTMEKIWVMPGEEVARRMCLHANNVQIVVRSLRPDSRNSIPVPGLRITTRQLDAELTEPESQERLQEPWQSLVNANIITRGQAERCIKQLEDNSSNE